MKWPAAQKSSAAVKLTYHAQTAEVPHPLRSDRRR
jgi:hypothetical protein